MGHIKCYRAIALKLRSYPKMFQTKVSVFEKAVILDHPIFTFSLHMKYVKKESIVIAWVKKKKFSPFVECSCFVCLRRLHTQKKKIWSVCLSVRLSVCRSVCLPVYLSGCLAVCTWTFHVDTISFEGVSGSKQNLVGVFYVWNIGLVLKSKVISWSWSWTEFWFSQKLCGATLNLVDIFSI